MVSFNIRIATPSGLNNTFYEGFLSAHLQLDPQWGIYGFVLAVMCAILVNQVIVWYNRKSYRIAFNEEVVARKTIDVTYNVSNIA